MSVRKTSQFCKSDNYFCRCLKCRFAIKKAQELDFKHEMYLQRIKSKGCDSSCGKLSIELMREVV